MAPASIPAVEERLLAPWWAGRVRLIGKEEPAELLRWQLWESAPLRLERSRAVMLHLPRSATRQKSRLQPERRPRLLPLAPRIPMAASAQMTLAALRRVFLAVRLTSSAVVLIEVERVRWVITRPGYWWSSEEVLPWLGLLAGSVSERET